MEPNETNELMQPEQSKELLLTSGAQYYLHQISRWTKFLSIMGFIGAALMALFGLFFSTVMTALSSFQTSALPAPLGAVMGVFYLLIAVFYFFASLYLYQFGEKVKTGLHYQDPLQIESGFGKLKSLFKMIGITTIVFLAIYAVAIVFGLIAVIFAARMGR